MSTSTSSTQSPSRQSQESGQSGGNKMDDTLTRARQEREKQGPWEVEVSYGGEADLHRTLASCEKNPGHQKFITVGQFSVDHLPPGCQDNDLVDLVRAMSDLTVRVSVKYVSKRRPETDPGSGKPYPCYKDRGRNMMRAGTGWVCGVAKSTDEQDNEEDYEEGKENDEEVNEEDYEEGKEDDEEVNEEDYEEDNGEDYEEDNEKDNRHTTCPCQECGISPTPKTQFAHIHIKTAAHVVYDSLEAAHTTCHLFFDKGSTPAASNGVVTLRGGLLKRSDVDDDADCCEMSFVTHDLDLAYRLEKMARHWYTLRERFEEKMERLKTGKQQSSSPEVDLPDPWHELNIIVSHPHGCSKQVSVGSCVDRVERWKQMSPRTYTTATCPGSSGAYVWWVKRRWMNCYWGDCLVHAGNCEGNKNLNYCCYSLL